MLRWSKRDNNNFSIPEQDSAILIPSIPSDMSLLVSYFKLLFHFSEITPIYLQNEVLFKGNKLWVIFYKFFNSDKTRKMWSIVDRTSGFLGTEWVRNF